MEAIRTFQWEIEIESGLPGDDTVLTAAANRVSQVGMSTDTIIVDRVNDKFHYPGKVTVEAVTITFDSLIKGQVAERLFDWFRSVYDPIHGVFTPGFLRGAGSFKRNVKIYQLDNAGFPLKHIHLYGAYPTNWNANELNYSANEFHTLEVTLQPDFVTMEATP